MRIPIIVAGFLLGAWMTAGHMLWGLGEDKSLYYIYVPIGLVYVAESFFLVWMIRQALELQGRLRGPVYLLLAGSWVGAVLFGLTVPGSHGGQLDSIVSLYGGDFWREMSIALCNLFWIVALGFMAGAGVLARISRKPPFVDED